MNLPTVRLNLPQPGGYQFVYERLSLTTPLWATGHEIEICLVEESVSRLIASSVHGAHPEAERAIGQAGHLLVAGKTERKACVTHGWDILSFDADDDIGPLLGPVALC